MNKKLLLITSFILLFVGNVKAQTIINSLAELKTHLGDSNGNFVMTPGTYYFNTENCGEGNLFEDPNLLLFTGDNSTFDFTGVKIEVDTKIFNLYGNIDVIEFWTLGNGNVYKNLTLEDIGNTIPTKGAGSIYVDGNNNKVEGFKTTTRGSFPYGYGDTFGKGGGSVINHNKHSGILVRGDDNHILNCTVIMRAYGHGIFVQGSHRAIIEGCYVEGETRTVGEVLQEEGTGSPADNVDFMTVWGFDLRDLKSDYTFSLQEAGVRAYSTGLQMVVGSNGQPTPLTEVVNGETVDVSRGTLNTTVKDCTIVKMRVGVNTGAEGGDNKTITNCVALACEGGFWLGHDGVVSDCRADASVGPILSEDISRSNATYEVTILDNYIPKIGNTPYFYMGGTNHNITIHDGTTYYNPDIKIVLGGTRPANRFLDPNDYTGDPSVDYEKIPTRNANGVTLINNTKYPVVLESASGCNVTSCGPVTNNGSGNSITQSEDCDYARPCSNTIDNLQAECSDAMSGIVAEVLGNNNEKNITNIDENDWISYSDLDLTGVTSVKAIASSTSTNGGAIEVRRGSVDGVLLATISVSNTSSLDTYQEFTSTLIETVDGATDVYFVFTGETASLFNLDKLSFSHDSCFNTSYNPVLPIRAQDYCESSGIALSDYSGFSKVVTDVNDGDYIKFSGVDFGYDDIYNEIEVLASSAIDGATIEVRSGAVDGVLLTTVVVGNTESNTNYEEFSAFTTNEITGVHDLYFVFKGEGDSILNMVNFYFNNDECSGVVNNAFSKTEALDYCEMFGVVPVDHYLGGINDGEWIRFASVDFTSISPEFITLNIAGLDETEGYINVMLDHPTEGTLIATATAPKTGSWTSWEEVTVALNQEVTGVHEVYFYFGNGVFNLDWFEFHQEIVELKNLALASNGAIASQSTTAYTGDASRANDGNTDGNFGGGSVSHTEHGTDGSLKWWQVDIGEDTTLTEIVVYNRTGGSYSADLNNFTVEVIKENGDVTYSQLFVDYPNPSIEINIGSVVGRIVKISKTSERGIQLAEVEVFGTETLSIGDNFNLGEISVSPNPATDEIVISNGSATELEVYNSGGALVSKTFILEDNTVFSLEKLSSGIHFFKFKSNQGTMVRKVIVK